MLVLFDVLCRCVTCRHESDDVGCQGRATARHADPGSRGAGADRRLSRAVLQRRLSDGLRLRAATLEGESSP